MYFEVHGYSKGTDDNILPGNITDLYGKVKFNQAWDTIVTLTWTAPGDVSKDGMSKPYYTNLFYLITYLQESRGYSKSDDSMPFILSVYLFLKWPFLVMGYDIQVFPSYENASSFDGGTVVTDHMIVSGSFTPSPAGENQSVTVKFHSKLFGYLETGYISVRAYDEYDNFGYGSNIVTIPLLSDGDSSPSTAQSTEWDSTNITEDSIPTSAVYAGDHAYDGIIASAVLLLLAVVCGLGIYAYQKVVHVKTKRRRKRYQPFIIGYPSDGTVV